MDNKEITFIALTTKYSEEVIHDIAVDLEDKNYTIEKVDLEGKVLEPQTHGHIRNRSIKKYQETLEDLDIVSWPTLEKSPTQSFPTVIKNTVVLYSMDEFSDEYYTIGRQDSDLKKLHKATEELISHTFGSYEYYEE